MATQPSRRNLSAGDSQEKVGRRDYNTPGTERASASQQQVQHEQVYTISGVDLTNCVMEEKQYANMTPMERFLRDGGGSLQRKMNKSVPKALL
ncbi:hypothetical protein EPUS_05705 [Endocarpon pusillum Z07020]|uniref:Uncharacterized protein n=1 Tax=Endocarpon pusillum (strain Z07020 / HMAS-L-300199) TaxID=1263415 RepID=U1GLB3_ENDPU|nr:uncharacterized protein EPUS_05705 [Endocarpon pusillum Z07020]ERF72651.1 hypothetical protein EPUS_05705 [Endocarpon pusillum Z07020]